MRPPIDRGQAGQALVGVLVTMVVLFSLAAGLALVVSAVLRQQNLPRSAVTEDLTAQNAITRAVAGVAGHGSKSDPNLCRPPGTVNGAACLRLDAIEMGLPRVVFLDWSQGSCGTAQIALGPRTAVWFTARGATAAFIDAKPAGCGGSISSKSCSPPVLNPAPSGVTQVAISCFLPNQDGDNDSQGNNGNGSYGYGYLHVLNAGRSPVLARSLASAKDASGSVFSLLAPTGLAGGPAYEEGDLFVSAQGDSNRLLFEAELR